MGLWDIPAKHEICDTELRFNPYHDPTTGRFTTANGGGSGAYLFSKGGKSAYVVASEIFSKGIGNSAQNATMKRMDKILTERPETDGIFASSDIIASQVLQVASQKGIKVPEELKVIGFDDSIIASYTTPPLTTIHQPIKEMAQLAVDTLINIKDEKSFVSGCTIMNVSLVRRGTT